MKPKVVIIGHGYLSRLSLVRSVAELGCEITVVVMTAPFSTSNPPKKPIDCYSKYVDKVLYCARKDRESLIALLLKDCNDPNQKVVLIPDGDDVVATIDNHKEILAPHFLFPHIEKEPSSVVYWMEKTNQKQMAQEVGLHVAEGRVIEISDGHYHIPSEIKYPCYSKPLATMTGGKGGMRRCDNEGDLESALQFIIENRNKSEKVLVEDYKEIETEFALLGFSNGREVVIPGILEFLAVSKFNKGIALQGKVETVTGFEDIVEKFKQLILKIGFVGVFDIDFYKSGGLYYFCELNLRYGGSGYAITKMGVNLPAMMVRFFYGESIDGMQTSVTGNATYINERMCMDDLEGGYITYKEYRRYKRTADIRFVPDAYDPAPEKAYRREYRERVIVNWVKSFLRK